MQKTDYPLYQIEKHIEETNCEIEEIEIDGKPHLKAKIDVNNQTLTDIVEKTSTPRVIYYEKVEATDSFIQKANDHVTIYYMGMAIVLGMSNLSLPQ